MSELRNNNVKTSSLDTPTTSLILINDASVTTMNLGISTTIEAQSITIPTVKQKVYYFSTQTLSPTVNNFLANGTIIISLYSSANPTTVNDIITITLPPPTASLNGCYFLFRKLRGIINNGTTNFTFTTSPASILPLGSSLTSGSTPILSTQSFNSGIIRAYVVSYSGTHYWTFA